MVLASDYIAPVTNAILRQTGLSAAALNADLVPSTDVSNYSSATLQLIGSSASLTLTFQVSNDNTNWIPWDAMFNQVGISPKWSSTTVNPATGSVIIPLGWRYLRVRCTAYSSGSVAGTLQLQSLPIATPSTQAYQNGTWTVGLNSGTSVVGGFYPVPNTSSTGLSSFVNNTLTALTVVKASAGRLHRIMVQNPNNAGVWLQVFNSATTAAVTLGTTVPLYPVYIPANGYFEDFFEFSDNFSTGITVAATTSAGGATVVTIGLAVSLGYL